MKNNPEPRDVIADAVDVIAMAMASHPSLSNLYSNDPDHYVNGGHLYGDPSLPYHEGEAPFILAALRTAGYETYRPEECDGIWWCENHHADAIAEGICSLTQGNPPGADCGLLWSMVVPVPDTEGIT